MIVMKTITKPQRGVRIVDYKKKCHPAPKPQRGNIMLAS